MGLWVGVLSVLLTSIAMGSETARPSVVDTAIAASNQEADAFVAALGDRVERLGLRMRVERRQDAPREDSWPNDVVAGVWIDARAPDRIEIRMTSARARSLPRTYERSLAHSESEAVVAEVVAQVVVAALESIVATAPDDPGAASAEASSSAGPVPPLPPEDAGRVRGARAASTGAFGLDVLAFASERAMSARSGPVLGAGGAVITSLAHAPLRPSLWISGDYDARFDEQRGQVTFDVGSAALRLIPSVGLIELDALQVDLGVGGGVDLLTVAPLVVRASAAVFDVPTRAVDPVLAGQLLMRVRLASQVRMIFGFDADYDCAPPTIAPADDHPGSPRGTFEPWRLRPALTFGLCVPLSSGGGCATAH